MTDRDEADVPEKPADGAQVAATQNTDTRSNPEISAPMLDVHAPDRSIHTLKDFLIHIAAVVIGIVIALTGEEVLQGLELRAKVRHTEELMREELALDDGPQVLQRIALAPCIEDSLGRIRNEIEQGAPRSAVIEAMNGFDPPRHTWDSVAFQGATASGIISHLPSERVWRWIYVYSVMPVLDRANEREFLDVAGLRSLSSVGGPLTEPERGRLLETVEALRRDNADIVAHVTPAAAAIKDLGIRVLAHTKPRSDLFSPAGPSRVIEQLRHLPMAAACLPALESAMGASP
jgi:hypothetical protein